MLIAITEFNAWENERWTYVLDIDKQDGEILNNLMIFIREANQHFDKVKEITTTRLFAAARYNFRYYNELDTSKKYPVLRNKNGALVMSTHSGYNSNSFDLNLVISSSRMKSAMLRMRDKQENDLYKNFDSVFLKSKTI
jgi:hypothetical protein